MFRREPRRGFPAIPLIVLFVSGAGCQGDLRDQPREEVFEQSAYFPDGMSARHPPPGTVPQGAEPLGPPDSTGYPMALSRTVLERGRTAYGISCTPCHGAAGDGNGIVVQRGFPRPASFHADSLLQWSPAAIERVIAEGRGRMLGYAEVLDPETRWSVAAYVKALQQSRRVAVETLSEAERERLEAKR